MVPRRKSMRATKLLLLATYAHGMRRPLRKKSSATARICWAGSKRDRLDCFKNFYEKAHAESTMPSDLGRPEAIPASLDCHRTMQLSNRVRPLRHSPWGTQGSETDAQVHPWVSPCSSQGLGKDAQTHLKGCPRPPGANKTSQSNPRLMANGYRNHRHSLRTIHGSLVPDSWESSTCDMEYARYMRGLASKRLGVEAGDK